MQVIDTTKSPTDEMVAAPAWPTRIRLAACSMVAIEALLIYSAIRLAQNGRVLLPTLLGYCAVGAIAVFQANLPEPIDYGRSLFFARVCSNGLKVDEESVRDLYKQTSAAGRVPVGYGDDKQKVPTSIGNDIRVACEKVPAGRWSYAALRMLIDAAEDVERYADAVGYSIQDDLAVRYRYWQVVVAQLMAKHKVIDLAPYANYIHNGAQRDQLWVGQRIEQVIDNCKA